MVALMQRQRPAGRLRRAALVVLFGLGVAAASAQPRVGFTDRDDGVSCSFVDVGLLIPWPGERPTWVDAEGRPGGRRAFGSDVADTGDTRRVRRIELTGLVQDWWTGRLPAEGLLLRLELGFIVDFHSRRVDDPALRPQLVLHWANGRKRYLEATASATLDCSTYRGLGRAPTISARRDNWVALHFDLAAARATLSSPPAKAELVLVRTADARPGAFQLDVFALRLPFGTPETPRTDGIARRYPQDHGIAEDPDVFFADAFDARSLDGRWTRGMRAPLAIVDADAALRFEPLSGRALRLTIPQGQQLGLDLRYRFRERHGSEPTEVYFRYALRLAGDWLLAAEGGKLPGLAGTYGRAGWGGRRWDGHLGWSLRGSYGMAPSADHPAAGRVLLGTYAYHSKSTGYGEGMGWTGAGLAGLIEPNRWYNIEQRVVLNTPGREDGVLQVWIDGRLALARADLKLRDVDSLRIEEVWMNVFHGGTGVAVRDMHAFVDQVVVARRYIGPMSP